jgi:hypothetical protein
LEAGTGCFHQLAPLLVTTGAVPAERLVVEREQLLPVPPLYGGRTLRTQPAKPVLRPIVGLQHPLSFYDAFAGAES